MRKSSVGYPATTALAIAVFTAVWVALCSTVAGVGAHVIAVNQTNIVAQVSGVLLAYVGVRGIVVALAWLLVTH